MGFDLLRFGVWLASLLSGFGLGFDVVLCLLCGGFMFGLVDLVLGCCDVVVCLPVWFDRWVWCVLALVGCFCFVGFDLQVLWFGTGLLMHGCLVI